MELRPYQEKSVKALWEAVEKRSDNPVLVLPPGSGKTHLIAKIAKDVVSYGGKLLCLTHVRELISQAASHLQKLCPEISFGIYSAGLKSRDVGYQVTLAGIQSVAGKAELLGPQDIILVDEAHRVPFEGEGQYQTFLQAAKTLNPNVRLIGLTATPYRLSSGLLCRPDGMFNHVAYEVGIRELIRDGWLSPIKSKVGKEKTDLSKVKIRAGEFVQSDLEAAMMEDDRKVVMACLEIAERTQDRSSVLVFCVGVEHAKQVAKIFYDLDVGSVATVLGDTASDERDRIVEGFRKREIKYLINVEVLTTGFDSPNCDCVAVLRPTMSAGLLVQMCGRILRKADGKKDGLILDYGGNFMRHGPIDRILSPRNGHEGKSYREPWKECPACQEAIPRTCEVCPECGEAFPKGTRQGDHDKEAYEGDVLAPETYDVESVHYWKHYRKNAPEGHPPTLWVEYTCGLAKASEWVCFEHQGFARRKAVQWWMARNPGAGVPSSVDQALTSIEANGILEPKKVKLEADGKYLRVMKALEFQMKPPKPEEERKEESEEKPREEEFDEQLDIPF